MGLRGFMGLMTGGRRRASGKLAAGVAVSMGEEPGTHNDGDAAHDEEFVADNERGKNHEGYATYGDGDTGSDAADDDAERRIENGGQTEQEESEADPDDAAQAGEFGSEFAGGVFLRRAELGTGANYFLVGDKRYWIRNSSGGASGYFIFEFRFSNLCRWHLPFLLERWWQ